MLCRNFELIPIKIGFFMNFQSCSKIRQNTLYYSTWSQPKFWQKWLGENSLFSLHFLIHIHVLMLCRKFELIPIKIGIFMNFQSFSVITIKWLGREFFNFYYFFLMYIHMYYYWQLTDEVFSCFGYRMVGNMVGR